jgi:hypothetical protein
MTPLYERNIMHPCAVELTLETIPHFDVEINWLGNPLGIDSSSYIGYFLVVDDDGPDLWAPAAFWLEYRFDKVYTDWTQLNLIKAR